MRIIKNFYCEECGNREEKIIQVTDNIPGETGSRVTLCKQCLEKALKLLEGE